MAIPEYASKRNRTWENQGLTLEAFAKKLAPYLGSNSAILPVLTTYPTTEPTKAGESFIYRGVTWSYMTQDEIDALGWPVLEGFPAPINKIPNPLLKFPTALFVSNYGGGQNPLSNSITEIDYLGDGDPTKLRLTLSIGNLIVTGIKNANLLTNIEDLGTSAGLQMTSCAITGDIINDLFNQLPVTSVTCTIQFFGCVITGTPVNTSIATGKGYTVVIA